MGQPNMLEEVFNVWGFLWKTGPGIFFFPQDWGHLSDLALRLRPILPRNHLQVLNDVIVSEDEKTSLEVVP